MGASYCCGERAEETNGEYHAEILRHSIRADRYDPDVRKYATIGDAQSGYVLDNKSRGSKYGRKVKRGK